ncbi:APH(3') family aminoglycoside O-phosphotransferase [Longispora albida]|uniref:APH(3') family aminoglycoside O-phosphotransferase n=1 Tax=Longispora albida TaxID=203523 RepID=UPI00037C2AF4|nr:APH(3') family aminoglycoside O-phosphotransferase [Longispora albida]
MSWEEVTIGRSGAAVARSRGVYRKTADPDDRAVDLVAEGSRLAWLRGQGIPAPEVLDCRPGLLVTAEVPGRSAAEPWPAELRPKVIDALAEVLVRLHALPVAGCPYDRTLAVTIPEALGNEVDLEDLDAERSGWTRDQLVAELLRTRPGTEDLVVTHGDLCVPNVLFDPETCEVTGLIDVERLGVGDRWIDLAICTRSLTSDMNAQWGPELAARFLSRYGAEPDPGRIAFFRLLDEFC